MSTSLWWKKNIFGRVDIIVKEYNILLRDETDNGLYLSNGKKVQIDETVTGVPSLINVVDEKVLDSFLKKLKSVLEKNPNGIDHDNIYCYLNEYMVNFTHGRADFEQYFDFWKKRRGWNSHPFQ